MPRLSEVAAKLHIPDGVTTTGWPLVRERLSDMGISYDPWQVGFASIALGKREDGLYAATIGGVGASIPRQVGKTFTLGSLLMALCVEFPGTRAIWTAHRARTATNTFQSMQGMARRKRIAPHVASIRTANGEQEISFKNGSKIMFGAREQGFGRGFDAIDFLVFDEAQILTEKALEDMVPATNQARHPHGALIFLIGTPPRPVDPGEVFSNRRSKALAGEAPNAMWVELSADPDAKLDDHEQWARANPSFPTRTPLESMLRMRENLGSDDAWRREALGIWDELGGTDIFGGTWGLCEGELTRPAVAGLAVAADPDLASVAIVAAGVDGDVVEVKPLDSERGTGWVVAKAKEHSERHGVPVVVDGRSPAAVLIPHLELAGIEVVVATTPNVFDACASFEERVRDKRIRHDGNPKLAACVAVATKSNGERWALRRRGPSVALLEAAILAAWQATRPIQQRVSAYADDHDLVIIDI